MKKEEKKVVQFVNEVIEDDFSEIPDAIKLRGKGYIHRFFDVDFGFNNNSTLFHVTGRVKGTYVYELELIVSLEFNKFSLKCDCPASSRYSVCKHEFAFLHFVQSNFSTFFRNQSSLVNSILYNKGVSFNFPKHNIQIFSYLKIKTDYYSDSELELNFKISKEDGKKFVIRSLSAFISNITNNSHSFINFGKDFDFSAQTYKINNDDFQMLQSILGLMYKDREDYYDRSYYGKKPNLKSLNISSRNVEFVINLLKDFKHLYFNNSKEPIQIKNIRTEYLLTQIKDKKDFNFETRFYDDKTLLDLEDIAFILTSPSVVFMFDLPTNRIYLIKDSLLASLLVHQDNFDKKTYQMKILKEESPIFFREVLPGLQKRSKIIIDESIVQPTIKDESSQYKIDIQWNDKKKKLHIDTKKLKSKKIPQEEEKIYETQFGHKYFKTGNNEYIVVSPDNDEKLRQAIDHFELNSKSKGKYELEDLDSIFDFLNQGIDFFQNEINSELNLDLKNLKLLDLKKIEANIEEGQADNIDFFEINFNVDGIELSIEDIIKISKNEEKYFQTDEGEFIDLDGFREEFDSIIENFDNLEENKIPLNQYYFLFKQLSEKRIKFEQPEKLKSIIRKLDKEDAIEPMELDESITMILRDYQKKGIDWMNYILQTGFGGILADDMGLGKTIQALTVILNTERSTASIIICPTSLIYNWKNEIKKFFQGTKVGILYGEKSLREKLIPQYKDYDILITSYAVLRKDYSLHKKNTYDFVILDEAQNIKNYKTQTAKSVKALVSKYRFVLSGTPIENSLAELWSIFDFIMPGYMPKKAVFSRRYEKPIAKGDEQALKEISMKAKPFLLRRLKTEVLQELPDKIENHYFCELNEKQKKLYVSVLANIKETLSVKIKDKGFERSHIEILSALMKLRQICCHPNLIDPDKNYESAKLDMLLEIIDEAIAGNHKILIFSQFVKMLKIIEEILQEKNIEYEMLHGGTKDRMDRIDNFNNNDNVKIFLLSLKAGGTGLNLTAADTVIHYDPWWNPAVEDQATDRAHRIGQKKVVNVYKLISKGSIEEKILELQKRKKDLIDKVIKSGEPVIKKLTWNDFKDLLDFE